MISTSNVKLVQNCLLSMQIMSFRTLWSWKTRQHHKFHDLGIKTRQDQGKDEIARCPFIIYDSANIAVGMLTWNCHQLKAKFFSHVCHHLVKHSRKCQTDLANFWFNISWTCESKPNEVTQQLFHPTITKTVCFILSSHWVNMLTTARHHLNWRQLLVRCTPKNVF